MDFFKKQKRNKKILIIYFEEHADSSAWHV